jgi:isocitrate/isopropylmalate dehydrogenase
MQIINPKQFDVILLKIYLEIFYLMKLVLLRAQLIITIGIIRNSSALFEPIHGSFQKEKINIANPIASIIFCSNVIRAFWIVCNLKVYEAVQKQLN